MSVREGNLEPPKRHPLDWRNPDFYDEARLFDELHRVYDVCHGCRRCFNLCNAFPRLFDLIDEGPSGELDGVDKARYWDVVDQCYLCDMCFMTKCPYVPPHPLNIDFPHLMLRAKAVKFRTSGASVRDRLLTSTDAVGKLAAIPVVAQVVNGANRTPGVRSLMQKAIGVHRDRVLPDYASRKFRGAARPQAEFEVRPGAAPGRVALFATCYINCNEPDIGHDLLKILAHNEIPVELVNEEVCCGMPKLELGDLETVAKHKARNIPVLARLAREGYAILTAVPSCTLMFKQELPLMFPDDPDVAAVAEAMFDPFEYLMSRHRDGLLKTDFKRPLGKIAYHVPCHLRVQNMGNKTRDLLKLIPDTQVDMIERCSGHDGTWGVKAEYFEQSMKIGRPVFKQMAQAQANYVSSDCAIAGRHICQGIGEGAPDKAHPLTLLRIAYGL
ncbi:MAG: Fe-S oxidoreductase [Betaproteobacteria bacterium]|nr:MAG: Fe-S oxidoreductase [Betaproteobacteria bacterium]